MKLKDIAKRSKRLKIQVELSPGVSDELNFDYRPSAYTADMLRQMSVSKLAEETDEDFIMRSLSEQPKILAQLISWWDATEEDGKTLIAPSEEVLTALDIPFRTALLTAITRDINPDPQTPTPLNAGSFTTAG